MAEVPAVGAACKDGTATIPEPMIITVANSFFIVLLPFVRFLAASMAALPMTLTSFRSLTLGPHSKDL